MVKEKKYASVMTELENVHRVRDSKLNVRFVKQIRIATREKVSNGRATWNKRTPPYYFRTVIGINFVGRINEPLLPTGTRWTGARKERSGSNGLSRRTGVRLLRLSRVRNNCRFIGSFAIIPSRVVSLPSKPSERDRFEFQRSKFSDRVKKSNFFLVSRNNPTFPPFFVRSTYGTLKLCTILLLLLLRFLFEWFVTLPLY